MTPRAVGCPAASPNDYWVTVINVGRATPLKRVRTVFGVLLRPMARLNYGLSLNILQHNSSSKQNQIAAVGFQRSYFITHLFQSSSGSVLFFATPKVPDSWRSPRSLVFARVLHKQDHSEFSGENPIPLFTHILATH